MLRSPTSITQEGDMAVSQQPDDQSSASFLLDALYCEEEEEEGDEVGISEKDGLDSLTRRTTVVHPLLFMSVQDMFWEDDEFPFLLSKEEKQQTQTWRNGVDSVDECLGSARREAVEWLLKVNAHHGFSTHTAILAINYLDRFLTTIHLHKDDYKPWMIQIAAVTCLSLAAKVEESYVPLLVDLQVDDTTKYMFEAKTIQKMELLVLSSLEWKMHPVTPLSFLDHIIRRVGLKSSPRSDILQRCERLLLSLISDSRFFSFPPSVLAAATVLHLVGLIEHVNPLDYMNRLLGLLSTSKGKVEECCQFMLGASGPSLDDGRELSGLKRKYEDVTNSPNGVIDGYLNCESSNDSWAVDGSAESLRLVATVMKKKKSNIAE